MLTSVAAVAVGASLVLASILIDLPIREWTAMARYLVIAFVVLALTLTMTASAGLILDAGPLQIWPLGPLDTL